MRGSLASACIAAVGLLAGPARALPVDDYVTVQLIDVCNGTSAADSTHCAPVQIDPTKNLYDFVANPVAAVAETTWQQAGISFNFLPTINKYYNAAFLSTTVDDTPTDEAHQLFRDPGHGQNPAANTLNLFFVDSTPTSSGLAVYGYALQGSNGAVISGAGSALDTVAHELGHNLGLQHVDGTPSDSASNLMRSRNRLLPTSLSDITAGVTDQLYGPGPAGRPDQIDTARQPLFTVRGAAAKVQTLDLIESEFYVMQLSFDQNGSGELLNTLKIRYLDAAQVLFGNQDSLEIQQACIRSGSAALIGGTGNIAQLFKPSAHMFDVLAEDKETPLTGGLDVTLGLDPACVAQNPVSSLTLLANATVPFSFEFDFTDGKTSTGLYDQTTGTASSTDPITVGFVGQPTLGLDEPPPPEIPHPAGALLDPIDVPAPGFPWLVAAAALAFGRMRGRSGSSRLRK